MRITRSFKRSIWEVVGMTDAHFRGRTLGLVCFRCLYNIDFRCREEPDPSLGRSGKVELAVS